MMRATSLHNTLSTRFRSLRNSQVWMRSIVFLLAALILLAPVSSGATDFARALYGRAANIWPGSSRAAVGAPKAKRPVACAAAPLKQDDHFLYAAVYSVKDGHTSTLVLNNTTTHDNNIRVTLFNKEGRAHAIPEMTLRANLSKRIDLRDLVEDQDLDSFSEGSVEIFFHGVGMGVGGQLVVFDYPHSLSFDVPFTEMMSFNSSQVDSLWWGLDNKTQAEVHVANTESVQTVVTPTFYVGGLTYAADPITLEAHHQETINIGRELKKLKVKGDTDTGAIVLQYSNGPGAIAVAGAITKKNIGFSSTMRFSDTTMYRTTTLHGAYLPIGKPDAESGLSARSRFTPHITVGNVADAPIQVKVTVRYRVQKDGNSVELAPVTLAAHEVRELDVSTVLSAVSGKVLSDSGIEITHDGPLGAIIGAVASVDQTGNQVFDVPLRDPKLMNMTAGGNHPWTIAGDNRAVLHLKNIDPVTNGKPRQAVVTLYFEGGSYNLPIQAIGAGQTLNVDIKKLRDEQIKDSIGNVIPLHARTGQVQWFGLGAVGQFIGRLVQYDPDARVASSYSCGTVCSCDPGYRGGSMALSPSSGNPGDTFDIIVTEYFDECQGDGPTEVVTTTHLVTEEDGLAITSDNTAIASVIGSVGTFGNTAGIIQISATWDSSTNPGCLQGDVGGVCDDLGCPNDYAQGFASANATTSAPTVTLSPLTGVAKGQTADVTVTLSPSPSASITLTVSKTTGTGSATFDDDTTTKTLSQTTTVHVKGVTESSTADNMKLEAKAGNTSLASEGFSVVLVTITMRSSGSDQVSSDNVGLTAYSALLGTTHLGNFLSSGSGNRIWRVSGVEFVGAITPNNYAGTVVLHRTIVEFDLYRDSATTPVATVTNQDDTSDSVLRDDDPQSGQSRGKIYDLDAPGIGFTSSAAVGSISRRRTNFIEYAMVGSGKASSDFQWFAVQSITKTANGDQLNNDYSGDNAVGTGTTKLTSNLQ